MFNLFYSFGVRIYYAGIWLASLWNAKAKKWINGRNNINEDTEKIRTSTRPCIWIHCASVGEFEQAYPLIQLLRNEYQNHIYHITFYSPSGYEYAKQKYPDESISYLPIDTTGAIEHFTRRIQPKILILIKYEFWFNLITYLNKRSIPVLSVSSIFREDQLFFKWYGRPYRQLLLTINHFFLQNEESAALLTNISVKQVTVSGDTRFDRVVDNSLTPFSDPIIESFIQSNHVFVAGSVWDSDLPALKHIISQLPSGWKIILAPHEIDHFNTRILEEPCSFYSNFSDENHRILVLDVVGILSKIYRFAHFSYVGGGFDKGLHNVLEPIVYGKPVFIGPKFQKFNEVVNLIKLGCIFPINEELSTFQVEEIIQQNRLFLDKIKETIDLYITENTNVSEKIAVYLKRNKLL